MHMNLGRERARFERSVGAAVCIPVVHIWSPRQPVTECAALRPGPFLSAARSLSELLGQRQLELKPIALESTHVTTMKACDTARGKQAQA